MRSGNLLLFVLYSASIAVAFTVGTSQRKF